MTGTDLHDTTRCPLGHRCESCGREGRDLAVEAVPIRLGMLCRRCAAYDDDLRVSVSTAARLVEQHAAHVAGTGADR